MLGSLVSLIAFGAAYVPAVSAHIALWHPSMWGFNVTSGMFPYDNRPVIPLQSMTFDQWWFHNHLAYPPHKEDFFELPAGGTATAELACDKGATSFFASSQGGDIRQGDWPCPNQPSSQFHTTGISDVKGCGLGIVYKDDVTQVKPEDFAIFSVNQTCVWNRFTDFQVPSAMPECPPGGCICAWFWIHSADSGSEQMYMTGFQCKVTGATGTAPIGTPKVARRCGADPANNVKVATPSNCTEGAKQPLYWDQKEGNNMFEGIYSPPFYNDLYDFKDGAQNDIFDGSSPASAPSPAASSSPAPPSNSASESPAASGSAQSQVAAVAEPTSSSSSSAASSSSPTSIAASSSSSPASGNKQCRNDGRRAKRAAARHGTHHRRDVGRLVHDSTFH